MTTLTTQQLQQIMMNAASKAKSESWIAALNAAMAQFDINTPIRQAAFLAQILHESGELLRLQENLNYSAIGLRKTWPNRFPDDAVAAMYANQPEKIANNVYSGRLGNGDEASGDGWKYRGRGLIQLTGRANYLNCGKGLSIDLVSEPELLIEPGTACLSAAWFWQAEKKLNAVADNPNQINPLENFTTITKKINGGTNGLDARVNYWNRAKLALNI